MRSSSARPRPGVLLMLSLVLFALVALTLPYALNITWALPGEGADRQLTYRTNELTWDSDSWINEDGAVQLSLFHKHYNNVKGETGKVVAPGTNGGTRVRLQNTVSGPIRYTAVLYRVRGDLSIPIDLYLGGINTAGQAPQDAETYALPSGAKPSDVVRAVSGTVEGYGVQELDVSWEWPFDLSAEQDAVDTAYGSDAPLHNLTVGLYITVEDENTGVTTTPKTGDRNDLGLYLFILALCALGVVLSALWEYRQYRRSRR